MQKLIKCFIENFQEARPGLWLNIELIVLNLVCREPGMGLTGKALQESGVAAPAFFEEMVELVALD